MNEPEGTGPDEDRESKAEIRLPSWIDAAISRTQDEEQEPEAREAPPAHEARGSLPEDAVEPMSDAPPIEELRRPLEDLPRNVKPSLEPFPSFLDRRGSMEYETERIAEEPTETPAELEPVAEAAPEPVPTDFLARRSSDDFEAQREVIVSQAMAEEPSPRTEPIPLPVAPKRRRAPSGPWLMAALFFAAAALVLGILIWLRPIKS